MDSELPIRTTAAPFMSVHVLISLSQIRNHHSKWHARYLASGSQSEPGHPRCAATATTGGQHHTRTHESPVSIQRTSAATKPAVTAGSVARGCRNKKTTSSSFQTPLKRRFFPSPFTKRHNNLRSYLILYTNTTNDYVKLYPNS